MNRDMDVMVVGEENLRGRIHPEDLATAETSGYVRVELDGGGVIAVPRDVLYEEEDGTFYLPLSGMDLETLDTTSQAEPPLIIPVISERLKVRKRKTTTGRVRITRRISEREEVVDEPGYRETVDVERVPVNDLLEEPAQVRFEGETMVIPVMEEIVVVQKRWHLKEEVRVTKRREPVHEPRSVVLREEEVVVERDDLDAEDAVDDA